MEIPLSVTNHIHEAIEYVFFTNVFEDLYSLKLVVHIKFSSLFESNDHAVEFKIVQIWKTKLSLMIPSAFSMSSSNQY